MRFARFTGEGRIAIDDGPEPAAPQGEVALRTLGCALCGSDLRPWQLGWPVTPGHEIVAAVDHPGHRLHGRRVLVYIPVWCGGCAECRAGHPQLCANATDLMGWQRPGGYAERLVAPEQCLIEVPDDVPTALAPLLLDTIGTAAHGVRLVHRVVEGGPALVLGAGPIGLGAIMVLQRLGFPEVAVVEPREHRRRFAAELGAAPVEPGALGDRRFALVVESSGKDPARQLGFEVTAPHGACLLLGESEAWQVSENKQIRRKDFFMVRSFYFPLSEFPENVALLRRDMERYGRFVDERVGLDGLGGLFGRFARGEHLKPQLAFAD